MPLIVWETKFSIGQPEIDEQHKKLILLINQFHDAMMAGNGKEMLEEVLTGLIDYTSYHFKAEEDLMFRQAYPDLDAHMAEHAYFIRKITQTQEAFRSGERMLTIHLMNFLRDWLVNHIMLTDKRIGDFITRRGPA